MMLCLCLYFSKQMAEEVLRGGGPGEDQTTGFEGMETLAQAIELGMCDES